LMPSLLQDLGLGMAAQHTLEYFCKHHDLECSWQIDAIQGLLAPEQEVIIYRIFQESLTNISKHARATRVTVAIDKSPGAIRFSIEDNGVGFKLEDLSRRNPVEAGLGLDSIEERARMLNGTLEIWSREGQGTRITLVVPLGGNEV
jgi:signal transduction histidine kinase